MTIFFSGLTGLIFGLGLIISGMTNPTKVIHFLDITNLWDPSLIFVMVGAIMIAYMGFKIAKKRQTSFLGTPIHLPTNKNIDIKLVIGSLLFGIGWGLAGICPGPAWVLLGLGSKKSILFIASMLAGMALFSIIELYKKD